MYAKCGDLWHSRTIFDRMSSRSLVTWAAIISGFVHSGYPREAVKLLTRLRREEVCSFDMVILVSALKASGELALLELCQQLHSLTFQAGFSHYRSVISSLISAYSKCGNVQQAQDVFQETDDGIRDVVSWNAIISGLGINGHGRTALSLFHDMLKAQEPDGATYLCVLAACSHSGLVEEGLEIFAQMVKDNRTAPAHEHFWCVVDLLARAGWLTDSNGFLNTSLEEKMGTNAWKALLSGCLRHGNTNLAEYAAKRIQAWDEQDTGEAVLISNVLASAGRFEDSEAWRSSIVEKGLMKNPGISYVK